MKYKNLFFVTIITILIYFIFSHFKLVNGISMMPTISNNDIVFYTKKDKYEIGDIVIIRKKSKKLIIKRIAGLAKTTLYMKNSLIFFKNSKKIYTSNNIVNKNINKNNILFKNLCNLNKEELLKIKSKLYRKPNDIDIVKLTSFPNKICSKNIKHHTVKKNMYFVLGDNRTYSKDSRFHGDFNKNQILGKVEYIF